MLLGEEDGPGPPAFLTSPLSHLHAGPACFLKTVEVRLPSSRHTPREGLEASTPVLWEALSC